MTRSGGRIPSQPLFVERQTYRLRRFQDAVRALPVLALLMWCVPLLWGVPGAVITASSVLIYVFLSWFLLSAFCGVLLWVLARAEARIAAEGPSGARAADPDRPAP